MNKINIEVAWMTSSALVEREEKCIVAGTTLHKLTEQLKNDTRMHTNSAMSVYGKKKPMGYILHEGDRVEVCLPLLDDPLLRRRARVKKVKRKA